MPLSKYTVFLITGSFLFGGMLAAIDAGADGSRAAPEFTSVTPDEYYIDLNEGEEVELEFEAFDPDGHPMNHKWFVSNKEVDGGAGTSGSYTFVTTHLAKDGFDSSKSPYDVHVEVTDVEGTVSNYWRINVTDINRPPTVSLDSPSEGDEYRTSQAVYFKTTYSDPDEDNLTVQWMFGDGETNNFHDVNHQYAEPGEYMINLKVSDGIHTIVRTVNITINAIIVQLEGLEFEPAEPKKKKDVTIRVTVRNLGTIAAEDIKVKFYIDDKMASGLIREETISKLDAEDSEELSVTWVAIRGPHIIYVVIEKSDKFDIKGGTELNTNILVTSKDKPSEPSLFQNFMDNLLYIGIMFVGAGIVLGKIFLRLWSRGYFNR